MPATAENLTWRERVLGGVFVLGMLILQLWVMGRATAVLSLGLVVAYGFWARTKWNHNSARVLPFYLLGVAVQCLHFAEEYLTGFQRELPRLFGYQWDDARFVLFNLVWLFLFIVAALGVLQGVRLAYLIAFFFTLFAGIGNGIWHPALAVYRGGYFPGVLTAPLNFLVGVALLRRLYEHRAIRGAEN